MSAFYVFTWRCQEVPFNFGDEITPFLLSRLSPGLDLRPVDFSNLPHATRAGYLLDAVRKGRLFQKRALRRLSGAGPVHCCIGSILHHVPPGTIVWGTGFLHSANRIPDRSIDIRALRGALTLRKLRDGGFCVQDVPLGDPALLLPLVLEKPTSGPSSEIGIVPHYRDFRLAKAKAESFPVVDVATPDVSAVVKAICGCEFVVSSSLHGLAVAHAYGIPAVWMKTGLLGDDDFKFKDYFSSVGIPFYEPVQMDLSLSDLISSARKLSDYSLPRVDLADVRRKLLEVAPFPVDTRFRLPI